MQSMPSTSSSRISCLPYAWRTRGAPRGKRNGNYNHDARSLESTDMVRKINALIRFGCCARVTTGHAAAPSPAINSRRLIHLSRTGPLG
jgi:hypothetical protein